MTDQHNPSAPAPDALPEMVAAGPVNEYQEAAIDYRADGVREANTMTLPPTGTRGVLRTLIAQREELGG